MLSCVVYKVLVYALLLTSSFFFCLVYRSSQGVVRDMRTGKGNCFEALIPIMNHLNNCMCMDACKFELVGMNL